MALNLFTKKPEKINNNFELNKNSHERIKEAVEKKRLELISLEPFKGLIKELKAENPEVEIYIVGGWVRDTAVGEQPHDIDMVIKGIPFAGLDKILNSLGRTEYEYGRGETLNETREKNFNIINFTPREHEDLENLGLDRVINITLPRHDDYSESENIGVKKDVIVNINEELDIDKDLERRAFTVNGVAINLKTGKLICPGERYDDLVNRIVRVIGGDPEETIKKQDMSRALVAINTAAIINGRFDEKTKTALRSVFAISQDKIKEKFNNYNDREKISRLIREKEVETKKLFNISDELPEFLRVYWNSNEKKAKNIISKREIGDQFKYGLERSPKNYIKKANEVGALKAILPEIYSGGKLPPDIYKLVGELGRDSSLSSKLAALLSEADIKTIPGLARRFDFADRLMGDTTAIVESAEHLTGKFDMKKAAVALACLSKNKLTEDFLSDMSKFINARAKIKKIPKENIKEINKIIKRFKKVIDFKINNIKDLAPEEKNRAGIIKKLKAAFILGELKNLGDEREVERYINKTNSG